MGSSCSCMKDGQAHVPVMQQTASPASSPQRIPPTPHGRYTTPNKKSAGLFRTPAPTSAPPSVLRDSERRGLRLGLIHKREHVRVDDIYDTIRELGHGMSGRVYLVKHKVTGDLFALKCMDRSRLDPELLEYLRMEINVLQMVDHPNVIKLYEYLEDDKNLYLILEYCAGGELFDRLHAQRDSRYSETEASKLVFRMVAAVSYLHHLGISHRDLKLENFIFESNEKDAALKLIDFGLAGKYATRTGIHRMQSLVGTPYYIAPEILNQPDIGSGGYTCAVDCWSLGVISYMLLSGTPPFKGKRDREVLQAVRRGKYTLSGPNWDGRVSDLAKDFIRRLLVYNPAKRMTAEAALSHPWLQKAKYAIIMGGIAHPAPTIHPKSSFGVRSLRTLRDTPGTPKYGKGSAQRLKSNMRLSPEILQNLRDFARMSRFHKAALEAIAFSTSTQSVVDIRNAFQRIDTRGTGFVTTDDFVSALSSPENGVSPEDAAYIFKAIDVGGHGSITYTEFCSAAISKRLWLSRERIRHAFDRLNVDGSGYITQKGLKQVFGEDWSPTLEEAFFRECNAEHTGKVDFESFCAAVKRGESLPTGPSGESTSDEGSKRPVIDASSDISSVDGGTRTLATGSRKSAIPVDTENNSNVSNNTQYTKFSDTPRRHSDPSVTPLRSIFAEQNDLDSASPRSRNIKFHVDMEQAKNTAGESPVPSGSPSRMSTSIDASPSTTGTDGWTSDGATTTASVPQPVPNDPADRKSVV